MHNITFGTAQGSNPGPFDPKSNTTTKPLPPQHPLIAFYFQFFPQSVYSDVCKLYSMKT